MKKFIIGLIASVLTVITLSGCAINGNPGVDTMLAPPKLSSEHEEIYHALLSFQKTKINLKYPKYGSNLSAFTVADIDGDGRDEAIVFYEKETINAEERSLRMNILDKIDGKWASQYDCPAEGIEVERVIISTLGGMTSPSIIVGYNMATPGEKQVAVYNYKDGIFGKSLQESYSIIDIRDLDGNGLNELLIIINQETCAKARVLAPGINQQYYESFVNLNENITEFKQLIYGKIKNNKTGLYIDELIGSNTLRTEILKFENNELQIISNEQLITGDDTNKRRPSSFQTADIDKDGVLEIPVNQVCAGYKDYPDSEKIYQTDWLVYEDNILMKKYESYYSVTGGFCFIFPERWKNCVTIKTDNANQEIIFFRFGGEITDGMPEIMRIAVVSAGQYDEKDYGGYTVMQTIGERKYLLKIQEDTGDPLIPSVSEVMFNLMFTA